MVEIGVSVLERVLDGFLSQKEPKKDLKRAAERDGGEKNLQMAERGRVFSAL